MSESSVQGQVQDLQRLAVMSKKESYSLWNEAFFPWRRSPGWAGTLLRGRARALSAPEEQFTVVCLTYKKTFLLPDLLALFRHVSEVRAVVIVWNDADSTPGGGRVGQGGSRPVREGRVPGRAAGGRGGEQPEQPDAAPRGRRDDVRPTGRRRHQEVEEGSHSARIQVRSLSSIKAMCSPKEGERAGGGNEQLSS